MTTREGQDRTFAGAAEPRILITRLSSIGDCVQTLPLACALRRHFPRAFLGWVVQPRSAPLLEGHACIDRLFVVDDRWWKLPRTLARLRTELRADRFEIVLDPQSLTKSAALGRLSAAPRRIGFSPPQGRELSRALNNELVRPRHSHVVDRYLELLEPLGLFAPAVHFDLPESRAATANVAVFLQRSGLSGSFAVLNPGAGWDSRLWPPDRYARVARHLGRRHGLGSVVTWSGARELSWAKQIVSAAGAHTVLAPSTDLRELAALLRAAVLFVGSDTGPLHLAAAVGTVCVSMHGTTKREVSGPYGPGHIALQESYEPGSSGHRRRASDEAMRAIDADMVSRACDEVLAVAR